MYKNYLMEVVQKQSDKITYEKFEKLYEKVNNMTESEAKVFVESIDGDIRNNAKTAGYVMAGSIKHPWEYAKLTGRMGKSIVTGKIGKGLKQDAELSNKFYQKMQELKNQYKSGKISKQEYARRKNHLEISILSKAYTAK